VASVKGWCFALALLAASCGGWPLPTDGTQPPARVVVCVMCAGGPCDLCAACADWPDAEIAASCPDNTETCEADQIGACAIQDCGACP
jgi:hypothetical protein